MELVHMRKCKYCNEDITGYASGSTFCWLCAWGGYKTRNKNNVEVQRKHNHYIIFGIDPELKP